MLPRFALREKERECEWAGLGDGWRKYEYWLVAGAGGSQVGRAISSASPIDTGRYVYVYVYLLAGELSDRLVVGTGASVQTIGGIQRTRFAGQWPQSRYCKKNNPHRVKNTHYVYLRVSIRRVRSISRYDTSLYEYTARTFKNTRDEASFPITRVHASSMRTLPSNCGRAG